MSAPLTILYQDDHVVAVDKPSGLMVHRSDIALDATEFAMQIVRDQLNRHVYPVHRLDRPTSGVLLFALDRDTARFLTTEFTEHRVLKTYWALVRGTAQESFTVDHALKEELDKIADRNAKKNKPAQPAITNFRRLSTCELNVEVDKYPTSRYSLVEANPQTGRKHQIRRHLKHANHPIIGDVNYGNGKHNRFFAEKYENKRLLLACTEMSFSHPRLETVVTVKAPVAAEYLAILRQLGLAN